MQVIVDDYFPVSGHSYAFAKARRADQVWVQVLEKAYSKVGMHHQVIRALLVCSTKRLTIYHSVAYNIP
jgi:hypothetical protein